MKNVLFLFFSASVMLFAGCSYLAENAVMCVQLDPLQKVFKEDFFFVEVPDTAAVAKGETATFQFVLRGIYPIQGLKVEAKELVCGGNRIAASYKAFAGYIRAVTHARFRSRDAVFPSSDLYPDCLLDIKSIDVAAMSNQPVWVCYDIPRNAADGNYSATLVFTGKVNGKRFKINKQINAKVFPVTLPEQTLWISNWWSSATFSRMNENEPVEPFSDRYWELLTILANKMRDYGQNSYVIWDKGDAPGLGLGLSLYNIKRNGSKYTFDFTNFDKMVELFIREGGLKRIEGGHLADRMGDWNSDFGVFVPNMGKLPFENEETQNFLSQFIPALYSHLESKCWTNIYVQHIADEPVERNAESYIRIAGFVKNLVPEIKILDAVMYSKLANTVDVWVPKLNDWHREYTFFQERQAAGDEVWFYTCVEPQGNYANRFMEQPLIQTRLLHWMNYRYGATGYLHWGFNIWQFLNLTGDAVTGGWPAGDAFIAYPARDKVYASIRLKAMRDGIADYELLKLLEQKSPDKAKELASAVIRNFDSYDSNIRSFRETRLKLLKWLSE